MIAYYLPPATPHSPLMSHYLLLGIAMAGRRCVVLGGGRVGTRKARLLADAGAEVIVVAPEISASVQAAVSRAGCGGGKEPTRRPILRAAWLAVAATDEPATNAQIARDAEARGILAARIAGLGRLGDLPGGSCRRADRHRRPQPRPGPPPVAGSAGPHRPVQAVPGRGLAPWWHMSPSCGAICGGTGVSPGGGIGWWHRRLACGGIGWWHRRPACGGTGVSPVPPFPPATPVPPLPSPTNLSIVGPDRADNFARGDKD